MKFVVFRVALNFTVFRSGKRSMVNKASKRDRLDGGPFLRR